MRLSRLLLREKTQATTKATVTFNSPGVYQPPYGKTTFMLQGQGTPGNASSGGNYAGTNPSTGGNYAGTNPSTGGNYAGTNPSTGGNYAGTNPTTYNPTTPGNYVPASGGNYAGTNPPTPGNYEGGGEFYWTNPPTPGNPYYNPYVAAYTNPPTPGNAVPGNPYYNPVVPGNAYYNPVVPGNAYYNPYVPGTSGSTTNVLGVTLPGGDADTAAPVVGYVTISVTYSNSGVPVSVPSGGYVKIQNN